MRKTLSMVALIGLFLAALDFGVATALTWAGERGKLGSLVRYFEYGRSVPGKLAQWEANPGMPGDLSDVAWMPEAVALSADSFAKEPAGSGPVLRSYGMSFVNNILRQAQGLDPSLVIDIHSGPAAPPNFTYALFLEDAESRRPGDFAVLGVLSSSLPALAAMSNRTWLFEQPAPFTYPVFHPAGDGLRRVDPLITSASAERALAADPDMQKAWAEQLAQEDLFYSPITGGATWMDPSPFSRQVRRSLAKSHIEDVTSDIYSGAYPYEDVLRLIIADFAKTARKGGQTPIVMLIQSRERTDRDVLAIAKPVLERDEIPYLATVEHFDLNDFSGFMADGHYRPDIDKQFAMAFLELLGSLKGQEAE